jgi:MarR family transcriptional regulator, organic hydroperoxide resistance regulator
MSDDLAQPPLEVLLERVGAAVTRHRRRIAAAHGLTPTTMAVLAALGGIDAGALDDPDGARGRADPVDAPSHRELAGRLGLTPATLTPVLDALEAAGEVRRERDRTDRRVVRLHRTPAGRARLALAPSARLPRPDPEVDRAVRAWLLAVLAAAETPG